MDIKEYKLVKDLDDETRRKALMLSGKITDETSVCIITSDVLNLAVREGVTETFNFGGEMRYSPTADMLAIWHGSDE